MHTTYKYHLSAPPVCLGFHANSFCFRKLSWCESNGIFFLKSRANYRRGEEVVNNVRNNKDLKMLLCKSHNKSSKNCCHVLHLTFNCDDLQKILPSIENFFANFCFVLTVAFKSKLLLIFEFDMKYGKLGWDLAIARYQPRPCGQQGGLAPTFFWN